LLAELGNEASGSNNKGKEMTGEMVGQRQENPTTPHKKRCPSTQPLPAPRCPHEMQVEFQPIRKEPALIARLL